MKGCPVKRSNEVAFLICRGLTVLPTVVILTLPGGISSLMDNQYLRRYGFIIDYHSCYFAARPFS